MLVCWTAAALAVLTKGIVVFVLAGGTLIAYSVWSATRGPGGGCTLPSECRSSSRWPHPGSSWCRGATRTSRRFFSSMSISQRFLTKEAQRVEPWWYFLALLLVGALPWLLPLARAALAAWRESSLKY